MEIRTKIPAETVVSAGSESQPFDYSSENRFNSAISSAQRDSSGVSRISGIFRKEGIHILYFLKYAGLSLLLSPEINDFYGAQIRCGTLLDPPALAGIGGTGFTLLFGLVPLLWISDSYDASRRSWWKVFGWALLTFVLWNVSTIWWIWLATPVGPFAATIASSFLNMVAFMLFHTVSKKGPKALAYTLLVSGWIATEYWYTIGDFSWPWLILGNGFSHEVWAVQWYEYTGIFGGTLWVLLSNILLYEAWRRRRDAKAWTWAGAVVLLPILVSLGIFWSYEAPDEGSVTVSVVQPNIDCYDKFAAGTEQMQERLLLSMIEEAPAGSDFIVLPETVWPYAYDERYLPQAPVVTKIREILREKSSGAMIVTGAETIVYYPPEEQTETARQNERGAFYDKFNSTLGIDTTACLPIHHKGRLVIGVESTPTWIFKALKFLVIDLGGTVGQLGVGEPGPAFVHNGVSVGTPICYEGLYGNFYGGFVREGARALLISSNDGWWGDTPGHKHLFSIARLRAVEHRRAIARSANTGTSGFIDTRGDVQQKLGWDRRGILTGEVELNSELTFYTRYGDYLGRISELLMGLCILYYIAYRIKKKNHLVK